MVQVQPKLKDNTGKNYSCDNFYLHVNCHKPKHWWFIIVLLCKEMINKLKLFNLRYKDILRESIPRQANKKYGGPQGDRGLGFSRRRQGSGILKEEERTSVWFLFLSTVFSLSHIKLFFSLSQKLMITQQLSLNSVLGIIPTMYPA